MSFFDKITSYDLITSLIPGAFLLEAFRASGIPFVGASQLATWILLAYAIGIFSNRFGSLVIEPRIQKFVKRDHTYSDYITATKKDDRIEALVEKATFYRTMLSAACVYLVGIGVYRLFEDRLSDAHVAVPLAAVCAIILFYFSYAKQESYISERVKKAAK